MIYAPTDSAKLHQTGNTRLVNYGIQNEESDLRCHVCVLAQKVYVYKTNNGAEAIKLLPPTRERTVKTNGIVTARGFLTKPSEINGIESLLLDEECLRNANILLYDTPTQKGNKAVMIARRLLGMGRFPLLPVTANLVTDKDLQIKGTDIEVTLSVSVRIQVKCDYKGGVGNGCTGFLFLQTKECNPFGYT